MCEKLWRNTYQQRDQRVYLSSEEARILFDWLQKQCTRKREPVIGGSGNMALFPPSYKMRQYKICSLHVWELQSVSKSYSLQDTRCNVGDYDISLYVAYGGRKELKQGRNKAKYPKTSQLSTSYF